MELSPFSEMKKLGLSRVFLLKLGINVVLMRSQRVKNVPKTLESL